MPSLPAFRPRLRLRAAWLALALLLVLAACTRRAEPGQSVPNFSVTTASGQHVSLASFHGKVLVLNFWATWCQPCVDEVASLNQLQNEFPDRSVTLLGISVDQDGNAYRRFLKQFHIDYLTARDADRSIPKQYGTVKYPETYIIDQNGNLVRKVVGETKWDDPSMVRYLKDLKKGS